MTRRHAQVGTCLASLALLTFSVVGAWALDITIMAPSDNEVFALGGSEVFEALVDDFGDTEWMCAWHFTDTDEWTGEYYNDPDLPQAHMIQASHSFTEAGTWVDEVMAFELATETTVHAEITFEVVELTLTSETVVSAANGNADSRLDIGLGESVVCTVTVDPPGVGPQPTWEVTGGGTWDPVTGNSTTFTAPMEPATCTVRVTVGGAEASLAFQVIPPDGLDAEFAMVEGQGTPGDIWIGCQSVFVITVLPKHVSFYAAQFSENLPLKKWQWPDGTWDEFPQDYVNWDVNANNQATDTVGWEGRRVIWLDGTLDTASRHMNEEYANEEPGEWTVWLSEVHHFACQANGSCTPSIQPANGQGASGTAQGPWATWELPG